MMIATLVACHCIHQITPAPSVDRRILVVHAETGEPIPGVEVLAVKEVMTPTWGDVWWRHRGTTDSDGEVLMPRSTEEDPYGWLFARAEGFGARAAGDSTVFSTADADDVRIELMPEMPVLIELLDFTGAPLPLAHLGVALGCGHTPDLLSATTGPDGRALLRGIHEYDGGIMDLFIVHPEVGRTSYSHVPLEDAVDGVVRVYAPSDGSLLRGQVLLPDATPAVGYAVGMRAKHRGPWAITDAEGEFQLYGWNPEYYSLEVVDQEGVPVAGFDGARAGAYRTLMLDGSQKPEAYVDGEEGKEVPSGGITFQISVVGEGLEHLRPSDRSITVEAWDPMTGMSFTGETKRIAGPNQVLHLATLLLPAGEYLVEVGRLDSPYIPMGLGRVQVDAHVPRGLGDPTFVSRLIEVEVPVPRLVTVEVPDYSPEFTFYVARRGSAQLFKPGEDGVTLLEDGTLQVERFAVPHGRLGFILDRSADGVYQRIDLEVEPSTRATDRWRLRKRLR